MQRDALAHLLSTEGCARTKGMAKKRPRKPTRTGKAKPTSVYRPWILFNLLLAALITGCLVIPLPTPISSTQEAAGPKRWATWNAAPAGARETLAAHNQVRSNANPRPSVALRKLQWSPALAEIAQAHANQCRYQHSRRPGVGENIYSHTGDTSEYAMRHAVESWAKEGKSYDYDSGRCSAKTCGHYTQIVWRASTEVGCAVAVCDRNSPFGARFPHWTMVVCNYSPAGNVIGRRPY